MSIRLVLILLLFPHVLYWVLHEAANQQRQCDLPVIMDWSTLNWLTLLRPWPQPRVHLVNRFKPCLIVGHHSGIWLRSKYSNGQPINHRQEFMDGLLMTSLKLWLKHNWWDSRENNAPLPLRMHLSYHVMITMIGMDWFLIKYLELNPQVRQPPLLLLKSMILLTVHNQFTRICKQAYKCSIINV